MGTIGDTFRLWRIARTLARHDALIPREYLDAMPASLKIARFILGMGPKRDKDLPPGQRLARALAQIDPVWNPTRIFLGGGNAKHVKIKLPAHVKITENIVTMKITGFSSGAVM